MSHISKIELEIKDLKALKNACKVLGFQFMENQKEFIWYGKYTMPSRKNSLSPMPKGLGNAKPVSTRLTVTSGF